MEAKSGSAKPTTRPLEVCVVGMGYIGLPTAAVLASRGIRVYGCDVNPLVAESIGRGETHIFEPQLDDLVRTVVDNGMLTCSTTPHAADVFIICVPTPITEDKSPDVSFVQSASSAIQPYLRRGNLVILESTSPPGTTDSVVATHAVPDRWVIGEDAFVAHCPERVLPGRILHEVIHNDRIVGGVTPACTHRAFSFYQRFVEGRILSSTAVEAELAKLAENAFRDVNIAFANELSLIAGELNADVWRIIQLANRHPRVNILQPGPGVGGHCISVDPWFLAHAAPDQSRLIQTARVVNDSKPQSVVEQVCRAAAMQEDPVLGCLGLAYKPDVDDMRESPSLQIVQELARRRVAPMLVCEPYVAPVRFPELALRSLETVLKEANVLVLLTDHQAFKDIDPAILKGKTLVDTRGIWSTTAMDSSLGSKAQAVHA